jgi:hypothetical protein
MATETNGRAKPGPKPTVTPKVKGEILDLLNLGLSLAETLTVVGISPTAFKRERAADEQFGRGVKSAALRGKAQHLRRVRDGVPQWQSSAWFLERKYGAEFGQRVKVQSSGRVVIKAVAGASLGDL